MSVLAAGPGRRRGTELLLAHCGALRRPSATERLNDALGSELAARLVAALARGPQGESRLRGPLADHH